MSALVRWTLGIVIAILIAVGPAVFYRWAYTHSKRLREVNPGLFYRSGQMTAAGFAEAVARYHLHTIINLQDDVPNPDISETYFSRSSVTEFELCRRLGVRYVFLAPDVIQRHEVGPHHPAVIEQFLSLMDDPATYPVLIHCRAGLHRTGVLTAVYRMEYQHWKPLQALQELKRNGFGEFDATAANDYIMQYILTYCPRGEKIEGRRQKAEGRQDEDRRQ